MNGLNGLNGQKRKVSDDPLFFVSRIINKIHSQWLLWTFPFQSVGPEFWAHVSCELSRSAAPHIKIGNRVKMDRGSCLEIPTIPKSDEPVLVLEDGCEIGRRCLISAKNGIHIGKNTIFGPSALVMDHEAVCDSPIIDRVGSKSGTIRIGRGCWIGFGAAILCGQGELVIGENSVIGANSVVTKSVPAYSVVSGNPGRVVKQFDPSKGQWVIGTSGFVRRG